MRTRIFGPTRRRRSHRQRAWEYMRRNPVFAVSDLLVLTGMAQETLREFLGELGREGYLRQAGRERRFRARRYRLIRNTGPIVPYRTQSGEWIDPNLSGGTDPPIPHPLFGVPPLIGECEYALNRLRKIFRNHSGTPEELSKHSGVELGKVVEVLTIMEKNGEVVRAGKVYEPSVPRRADAPRVGRPPRQYTNPPPWRDE